MTLESTTNVPYVWVIQCFVLVMEYIWGSRAPQCIFHNQHKHCITYLALTQLFPVFVTSWSHTVKYTHYVAFFCISLRSVSFSFSHGCAHMGLMDFISIIFIYFFPKIIWESLITDHTYRCIVWLVFTVCAFYPDSQTTETLKSACAVWLCVFIK